MSKTRASLKSINKRYHSHMKTVTKGSREKDILDSLSNGKNSYLRLDRLESSSFDKSWIEEIEGVIFDLGEIISNPRQTTKVEGNLVPVELARKTNAESVQHLASHTQYVKEIDEYGNVIPSKILSMVSDDDIRTYENRFIATFVRRLVLFVEKRYEFVSKFAELHDDEVLFFKNKSFVDGATVEIETKIKISHKSDDELSLKSNAYVERIKKIRTYILYFYSSPFMQKLKTEKDVHNPILQTNIIRKNPKYHHCYEVYKFIEKYDSLGVNYKVDEHYSQFTEDEMKEINRTLFANYITLKGKDRSKVAKTNSKVYKPKILNSLDDESFIYGPLLTGPIEFVRTDEQYQQYLESKLRKDLPLHPTKAEKEYYADEYAAKAEFKQDQKQLNDLMKRVEKSVRDFNKQAAKIDKEREQARLELLRQEQEIIKKEENDLLTAARNELINASLDHKQKHDQEEARKEREFLDSIKPAVLPVEMSHPESEPVTYDEAVADIWPQSLNQQEHHYDNGEVESVSYTDALGIKEAEVPTPMSHPRSKPVSYDEACKEIWPQLKHRGRPAKHQRMEAYPTPVYLPDDEPVEEPVEEIPIVEEAPIMEQPVEEEIQPAVVPVEMSHPYSKPVSYDEACKEIWPQLKRGRGRPAKQKRLDVYPVPVSLNEPQEEAPVEEPVEEVVDIKPAIVPVEMSHPYSEPVTYEEAIEQIWPDINKPVMVVKKEEKPSRHIRSQFKKTDGTIVTIYERTSPKAAAPTHFRPASEIAVNKKEKAAKEEKIKPAAIPVKMSHPHSEPVTYEQAVEQIWPNINKVAPVEEAPVEVAPKEPAPKKAAPKKAAPKKSAPKKEKPQPVMVEAPVVEEASKEAEPVKEEPKPVEPVIVEAPIEEKPVEPEPQPEPVVEEKKPVKKVAPKKAPVLKAPIKKAPVKKPEPKPAPKAEPKKVNKQPAPERAKIPGKFIVKTNEGYYVAKGKYSIMKGDAKIFDDFNLANDIKKEHGGKVVKL